MARDIAPLDGLDLNLLVTLRALLRESSVTRAAQRLGQTQPTVSRSLAALRATFDDRLLVRAGRGLTPTPMALSLRTPVERALAAIDRLRTAGEFDPSNATRAFRITLPDVLGAFVVPALAHRLQSTAPGISLQVLGSERDVLRTLLDDEVDVVVGAMPLDHPELYARRVLGMGWSVLFGPPHPASQEGLTFESWLQSTHMVLSPQGRPDTPGALDRLLAQHGHRRHIGLHLGYVAAVPGVLQSTPYVMSLPTPIATELARQSSLTVVAHPFEQLGPVPVRMIWHEANHSDAGHHWLREQVVAALESVHPPGE
ncbi:MAG: LysR family transcriptional regulator [Proteobacteria bacterium]|nr:LysR family transcriptional regulator [Pseudomonadota bacterium]